MNKSPRLYWNLFTSTLLISALTFGGGYVIVALMEKKFVNQLKFIKENEMIDIVAISQCAPGPVAVNAGILVGYRIGGALGALMTVLGTLIPPVILISVISLFYTVFNTNVLFQGFLKGMQACVGAVLTDVVLDMGVAVAKERRFYQIILMPLAFAATFFLNVNVVLVIICCGLIGIFVPIIFKRRGK